MTEHRTGTREEWRSVRMKLLARSSAFRGDDLDAIREPQWARTSVAGRLAGSAYRVEKI